MIYLGYGKHHHNHHYRGFGIPVLGHYSRQLLNTCSVLTAQKYLVESEKRKERE